MSSHYTSHTAKLPSGVEIFYTDSGAPASSDYSTLILLHGKGFNGGSWVHLHGLALQKNLRMVVWSRRDYPGSTEYTAAELQDLAEGRQAFLDQRALEIAQFMDYFIQRENTPQVTPDRRSGGFILAGWSLGNSTSMALLSSQNAIPKRLYERIEPYVMSLVLHDPPFAALGYPVPMHNNVYVPWHDPKNTTPAQIIRGFQNWVGGFFPHPDIASGKMEGLDCHRPPERSTFEEWTETQQDQWYNVAPDVRSDLPMGSPAMQARLREQTKRALFNEKLASTFFPNVQVLHLSCAETCWVCIWGYMETLRLHREALGRGEKVRRITFEVIERANHFVHFEEPERFLQHLVNGVRRLGA